eukprot:COSAG02_NODE_1412_length_12756_cov_57.891048_13_plen_109_part_00
MSDWIQVDLVAHKLVADFVVGEKRLLARLLNGRLLVLLVVCRDMELKKVQWLRDGMSVEEVADLFLQRETARANGEVQHVQGSETRMRPELEAAKAENLRLDALQSKL